MARILVTDAHLGSATSVIRSLGRRHHVVAAGSEPVSAGWHSRYAAERVRYPDPQSHPEEMAQTVADAIDHKGIDLVVPVTDEAILPLSEHRERIERRAVLAMAAPKALAAARDKQATHELADRLGVPTPHTRVVETAAEARRHVAELGWPVVLKPMASRVFDRNGLIEELGVAYAGGFAGLEEHMRRFEGLCPVLLQRYHAGGAVGVEMLAHEGRVIAALQHRRLREVPITGGASSFRESVPLDATLYEQAAKLLGALRWTGLGMVEFKLTPDGPVLMEINGRIWGSLPLAVKAGMDFPARLADLFLSGPPPADQPPATSYKLGVRSHHLELELVWIGSVLRKRRRYPFLEAARRRDALIAGAGLLSGRNDFDMLSSEDRLPALADALRIGRKIATKVANAT